ncbi:excinuclease ABC A subunit [Paenibacillus cellulosilyticus]|uniref:UvrABC system protein A n=1 Tax=Paenibacillus cellulosilyticus TaxID=375489 RepID=A0A2V2Z3T7_9BACL|nr:ATP-binding cassette domain-containing protein [Paenibacillus cellulosilyticus]PWW04883.1 excinuclease ABC A subunit [Paenibacillus cellulosilyticus]QKS45990.1 ATP-binding cassette domain-containing protein [Paenibacillus cellulosilyticus]
MATFIEIQGARIHNLNNINVRIPRGMLTVITGVSGSGKSSLAFDTLYEEGKRRYLMFSGTQFIVDSTAHFDSITGMSPTAAVEQRIIRQSNPRSTVGTRTKIGNLLAVLFASYGSRHPDYEDGEPLSMEYFLRNSPKGMCVKCLGTGQYHHLDEEAIVPMNKPIKDVFDGFIMKHRFYRSSFKKFCELYDVDVNETIGTLSEEVLTLFKYGCRRSGFIGAIVVFHDIYKHSSSENNRHNGADKVVLWGVRAERIACSKCSGHGLSEHAIHTTVAGKTISELEQLEIGELLQVLRAFKDELPSSRALLDEMTLKLSCMSEVGLHHLSLSRQVPTLSGGEIQRLFLASYIIAEMDSIIYIFDEPTIGLHETEKALLIRVIRSLVKRGNTVVAVEHDEQFMRAADYIVDIGPGAGVNGGNRIFQGTLRQFMSCGESRIAPYLSGERSLMVKQQYKPIDEYKMLTITNATLHNLKGITVSIPLGVMVGVAGVSGSGKSSLIHHTLVPKLKQLLRGKFVYEDDDNDLAIEANEAMISGTEPIKRCIVVGQRPIGRSKTSCPATYTGIADRIRALLARTEEAMAHGYAAGLFTVNSEGSCKACKGEGVTHYHGGAGNFVEVECELCSGTGYAEEALSIRLDGRNMIDILEMSVSEAAIFFGRQQSEAYDRTIHTILTTLERVGLGYMTLGQKTTTISGGEAQRIKLAKELCKPSGRDMVYILDEPTTGLSFADTEHLISLMQQLVDAGSTVIVTEHDPSVLSNCDYLIELGPGGGREGGEVIATGTPSELIRHEHSIIGSYLRKAIG